MRSNEPKAMFTLYRNGASQKVYRIGLLFTLGTLLSKQFLLRNNTAPLRCWKWNVPYRIGFWNGPSQVWTVLPEQKLQRNFVLVNDLFKSKGSVANCITDRASVHTGNTAEHFLHLNRTLILVHTVPEQLLQRSKAYPVQCEHSPKVIDESLPATAPSAHSGFIMVA